MRYFFWFGSCYKLQQNNRDALKISGYKTYFSRKIVKKSKSTSGEDKSFSSIFR